MRKLICTLSTGEDVEGVEVPDLNVFRSEATMISNDLGDDKLDMDKILSILDVNSLVEDTTLAKVFGKNSDYYGVGLWMCSRVWINDERCRIHGASISNAKGASLRRQFGLSRRSFI